MAGLRVTLNYVNLLGKVHCQAFFSCELDSPLKVLLTSGDDWKSVHYSLSTLSVGIGY